MGKFNTAARIIMSTKNRDLAALRNMLSRAIKPGGSAALKGIQRKNVAIAVESMVPTARLTTQRTVANRFVRRPRIAPGQGKNVLPEGRKTYRKAIGRDDLRYFAGSAEEGTKGINLASRLKKMFPKEYQKLKDAGHMFSPSKHRLEFYKDGFVRTFQPTAKAVASRGMKASRQGEAASLRMARGLGASGKVSQYRTAGRIREAMYNLARRGLLPGVTAASLLPKKDK